MTRFTHSHIVDLFKLIATAHKGINGFYRMNWNEINGAFRSGIKTPALLLESHSIDMDETPDRKHFSFRQISFLLLDFTGKADNYNKQEEVLDNLENIALDIASYFNKLNKDSTNKNLYGSIDFSKLEIEKVGPVFDNMYGWNVKFAIKKHEPLCFEPDKWDTI